MHEPWATNDEDWKQGVDPQDLPPSHSFSEEVTWEKGRNYTIDPPAKISSFRANRQSHTLAQLKVEIPVEPVTFAYGTCCGRIEDCPWFPTDLIEGDHRNLYIFIGVPQEYSRQGTIFAFPVSSRPHGRGSRITEDSGE